MAGKYYYSTPIGQGMANLSEAIGGLPEREAKVGLLAQQRMASEAQARAQDAHAQLYGAQAADQQALTGGREQLALSVENFGNSFQGGSGGANSAAPSVVNAVVPSAEVRGVGVVPGAAPTMPTPVPPAMPITTALGVPPAPITPTPAQPLPEPAAALPGPATPAVEGAPTAPTMGSLADQIAPMVQAFQKLPPQTQQQMFNAVMGNSVRAGHQYMKEMPDFNLGVAGGNRAIAGDAAQPFNDRQFSDWQTAAGKNFNETSVGGREVIKQRADEATQKDATKRYEIGVESGDRRRNQDLTNARVGARGGGAGKPMKDTELVRIRKLFSESGGTTGVTPAQLDRMMDDFQNYIGDGLTPVQAANKVVDESWTEVTTPEQKNWFSPNVPAKTETKFAKGTRAPITPEQLAEQRAGAVPPSGSSGKAGSKPTADATPLRPITVTSKADLPAPKDRIAGKTTIVRNGKSYTWDGSTWR